MPQDDSADYPVSRPWLCHAKRERHLAAVENITRGSASTHLLLRRGQLIPRMPYSHGLYGQLIPSPATHTQ